MVNVGVDLHKTQFTVCLRECGLELFNQYPKTEAGYEKFLAQMVERQKAGETARVGVESTGNTRYFKNRMEAAGIEVRVINTLKVKSNERVSEEDGQT
jgi:transposase